MFAVNDWIVLPGGPGLSYSYLELALKKAFTNFQLYFYHPLGSVESISQTPSIEDLTTQIQNVAVDHKLKSYGLITHSFGNYLALNAIHQGNDSIKALIMLNPIPFRSIIWKQALDNLIAQIPKDTSLLIEQLSNKESGAELFKTIYPFYTANKKANLDLNIPFDIHSCNYISAQIPEYNHRELVQDLKIPLIRIVGEQDLFYLEQDIVTHKTISIPDTGHYPFLENFSLFEKTIKKLDNCCH